MASKTLHYFRRGRSLYRPLLAALLCMSILGGCSYLSKPLPQVQDVPFYNPFRSGARVKLGALPALPESAQTQSAPRLKKQWGSQLSFLSYGLSLYPKILPAIDSDFIYQADHKGKLVILDKKSGRTHKIINIPYLISAGPFVTRDKILVASQDAKIVSIDKKTGAVQWAVDVPSEVLATPQANDKMAVVHATDGKIIGINLQDGKIAWTYASMMPSMTLRGGSTPYIIDDFVLAGLANGKLVALNLESGMLAWEKNIATPQGRSDLNRMVDIRADLIVQDGFAFVAAYQGNLIKIQLATGEVQWQRPISIYQTMQIDKENNILYLTDANHHVWALDQATGETLWEQEQLADRYITAPVKIKGFILVGDRGGYVHFLDKNTGQIQGRYYVGNKIMSDLVVVGNQVLISTQKGKLSAFNVVSS